MLKLVAGVSKLFAALLIMLERSNNHFDSPPKLFLGQCLAKFLNTSTKFFSCIFLFLARRDFRKEWFC